ncbi:MAG TPA: protein phosphatase 2C domain-containing protein, partial [Polyangiaceae bacterium]|nr:protein phosphatase 2C domain-containing protein [Polyangiaceae bacterium]
MNNPLRVSSAGASDVGRRRKHNEDVILVREDLSLWSVTDGAGGHNAGEVAAALAARSISNYMGATVRKAWDQPIYDPFGIPNGGRRLAAAIRKANKDVLEVARHQNKYQNMVCTAVAAALCHRSMLMHVAHVGDSRCYRLRSCQLEQLTLDHSLLIEVLEREPDLDNTIVARMPRNVVTRALGIEDNVRVTFRSFPMLPGDRYLLCSDGLSGMVDHPTIEAALTEPSSPKEAVDRLIALANENGGKDNISVIVIDVDADVDLVGWQAPLATTKPETLDSDIPEIQVLGTDESDTVGQRLSLIESFPPDLIEPIGELFKK